MISRTFLLVCLLVYAFVPRVEAATSWAVVIGISKYQHLEQSKWLQYADQDARSYADLLKSRAVGVPAENVRLITNEEATTKRIKDELGTWLFDHSGPDDTVYIYFAGHGVVDDKRNEAYLVTYDSDPDAGSLYSSAYSMFDLKRLLGSLKYRHLVLVEDACHSAAIGKDQGTRDLETTKINMFFQEDLATANQGVEKSDFIFTAAGSVEKSFEGAQWGDGHGVFTHFLVQGLKGSADTNIDGKVDADEITKYVRENVQRETNNQQHPTLANTSKLDYKLVLASNTGDRTPSISTSPVVRANSGPAKGVLILSTDIGAGSVQVAIDNDPPLTLDPQSPLLVELAPGSHDIRAERPGFKPSTLPKIVVDPGTRKKQDIKLDPEAVIPVGEWRNRLIDASSAKPADALKQLEALFSDLLAAKQNRPLRQDENDLVIDTLKGLSSQYAKTKQTAALKIANMATRLFEMVPVYPETAIEDMDTDVAVRKASAVLQLKIDNGPAIVQIDSNYVTTVDSSKDLLVSPGQHRVRVSRLGFAPATDEFAVTAGETKALGQQLKLAAVTTFVFSETPDVQVVRDDGSSVMTMPLPQVLNRIRDDQADRLRVKVQELKLNPQVSVALLAGIAPGSDGMKLQFRKDKYRSSELQVSFSDQAALNASAGDYLSNGVVRLDKMMGTLNVTSVPSGADVLLDGRKVGVTPLKEQFDIGDYEVIVKTGKTTPPSVSLKNKDRVSIKDGESITRNLELRPTLVFLGIHSANDSASRKPIVDAEKYRALQADIGRQIPSAFARYSAESQNPATYEYTRDFLLAALGPDTELAKQQVQATLKNHISNLRDRFESDLFLFGYYETETDYLSNNLRLYLFSSFSTRPDARPIRSDQPDQLAAVLKQIDDSILSPTALSRPYIGLTTIDTELEGHNLVALRVDQTSPAAKAGLQEGDAIIRVDGQPATSSKINEWIDTHPVGSELPLQIESAAGAKTISVKTDALPKLLVTSGSRDKRLLNPLIVQLQYVRQTLRTEPATVNTTLLNEALAHMEFNRWNDALESLRGFQDKVANGPILAAAVNYYRGYCWEQLGDARNAAEAFELSMKEPNRQLRSDFTFDFQTLSEWRRNSLR